MMDGDREDTVSAVVKFLAVINSVYTGLFLMPFLVLNDMFSFPAMTFFILKTDSFRDCHLTTCSVGGTFQS